MISLRKRCDYTDRYHIRFILKIVPGRGLLSWSVSKTRKTSTCRISEFDSGGRFQWTMNLGDSYRHVGIHSG